MLNALAHLGGHIGAVDCHVSGALVLGVSDESLGSVVRRRWVPLRAWQGRKLAEDLLGTVWRVVAGRSWGGIGLGEAGRPLWRIACASGGVDW